MTAPDRRSFIAATAASIATPAALAAKECPSAGMDWTIAGVVPAADGDTSSINRPDDAVDPGSCRQESDLLDDGGGS